MVRFALACVFAAAAVAVAQPAAAQMTPAVGAAQRAGIVGERYDGYLGFARSPSNTVRQQVSAINIRRRSLYTGLAARRGVSPQTVGIAAGCELLQRVDAGQVYMLSDGAWRRREAGQAAPAPQYCTGR